MTILHLSLIYISADKTTRYDGEESRSKICFNDSDGNYILCEHRLYSNEELRYSSEEIFVCTCRGD